MSEPEISVFQSSLPIAEKLERARTELLDLSARNRLLHVPRFSKSAKTIDVVDEKAYEVFRMLVRDNKAFTFTAGRADRSSSTDPGDVEDDDFSLVDLEQPADNSTNDLGVLTRHADTKLQTRMTPKGLQKRLLDLYHDSRTLEEEQGVNILFLALGTLNWVDPNKKENVRHAPLILVPVSLERGTAGEKFRLRVRQEDLIANLSLEAYLDRVHALRLPAFDVSEAFDPTAYLAEVAEAISSKPDWSVASDNIVLGFFSFAKFLMYRDLDPENWPGDRKLTDQSTVRALLGDGFNGTAPSIAEDAAIDLHISPEDMLHIVDADGSQTLAVHDVRKGRDLVIQGPPGTGKSQTIANVIASAVADGKTVLFVAEKMAALEVVKRRLDQAGVGDACLELHSNKANKRMLLDELRRTWELGSPRGEFASALISKLTAARDVLNAHATRMHVPHFPSQLTPYAVLGHLTKLRQQGQSPPDARLDGATQWSPEELVMRSDLMSELLRRVTDIGQPNLHPWNGVGLDVILPTQIDRMVPNIEQLSERLSDLEVGVDELARLFELSKIPKTFHEVGAIGAFADILSAAPNLSAEALQAPVWIHDIDAVRNLVSQGSEFARATEALEPSLSPTALGTSIDGLIATLDRLPPTMIGKAFEHARSLAATLPDLTLNAMRLSAELGSVAPTNTFANIERLVATAERVAAAPNASPDAFAATVWDHGVEQAGDLANAVAALEKTRNQMGNQMLDVAWTTDVRAARQVLATQTGFLRFLSADWRKANALVSSILSNPATPQAEAVKLLDMLTKFQAAASKVKDCEQFGRAAFGADWRGTHSSSEPLLALVAWMRTLRGLGAEPRLIASKLAQRSSVGDRAARTRQLLAHALPALRTWWDDLATTAESWLDGAVSPEQARLDLIESQLNATLWAEDLSRQVLASLPEQLDARIALIQRLADLQSLSNAISSQDELAASAFGAQWHSTQSDWQELGAATQWIELHADKRFLVAKLERRQALVERGRRVQGSAQKLSLDLASLAADLKASAKSLFGVSDFELVPIKAAGSIVTRWAETTEQLSKWVTYAARANKAREAGLAHIVDRLADGRLHALDAYPTFEMAYYEALLAEMVGNDQELGQFDGDLHVRYVQDFAGLDKQRIKAASLEVARAHHKHIPAREGGMGPVSVLRTEMAKRRGHMPIRQLMQKAGAAIQAIKPVVMMSPLSVAQFLTPGRLNFDLLVMDEASQIQPVDALGAIARCKQVVVVGDERQLPPTKFFAKMTGAQSSEDDDDDAPVADIESILGLFIARGLPQRMLRWHYRSRHQSLIAVSNREFYENKLFIVPSPYTQEAGMGLQFHHVPNGVFESGGTGTNPIEARAVAEAVMRHAKAQPELSLGVATFSVTQRRAIQDQLEVLRRLNPETENFFHAHPSEPFFVKNLENVQGDERDVIMISVGYAKNSLGTMAMRFGPLGADGGERRLNVLISRAKRRCEIFASCTDEDIDLARAKGKGVVAFKLFLHYARTGRLSVPQGIGKEETQLFEAQVATALQARGYQVHPNVGIAGIFIDLAIADPARPGRYLIGIECDGSSYHSARSARDRDRLRQAVLEDHGWIIHRVWITDWFQRPKEQLERAILAIESAKNEIDSRLENGVRAQRAVPVEIVTVDRGDVCEVGLADVSEEAASCNIYREASPVRTGSYELHETPVGVMAELVEEVVKVETPVHVEEVVSRLRTAWGLLRAGSRIDAAVRRGVELALERKKITTEDGFLSVPDSTVSVRDRGNAISNGLRKLEMISSREIAMGVEQVVAANFGGTEEEVATAVARMLGFRSTSTVLRKAVSAVIEEMLRSGTLAREEKMLVVVGV